MNQNKKMIGQLDHNVKIELGIPKLDEVLKKGMPMNILATPGIGKTSPASIMRLFRQRKPTTNDQNI